jgi:hypothetical protein
MEMHHSKLAKINSLNKKGQLGRFIPAFEGLEPYTGKLASTVLCATRARRWSEGL